MYKRIFSILLMITMFTNLSAFAQLSEVDGVYTENFEGYSAGADIMADKTLIKEYTKFEPELDVVNESQVMSVNSASGKDNMIYTNADLFANELNIIKFKIGADSSSKLNWGSTSSLVFNHTNASGVVVNDYIFDFAYSLIRHKEKGITEKGICAFSSKKMYNVEVDAVKVLKDGKYFYDVTYIVEGVVNTISFETSQNGVMRIGFKSTSGNKVYVDDIEVYGFTLANAEVNIENRSDVSVNPEIVVSFSDAIDEGTLMAGDMLVGSVSAETVEKVSENRYCITLSSPLEKNTDYILNLGGVKDKKGNSLKQTEFAFKTKNTAVVFDGSKYIINTSKTESERIIVINPQYSTQSMIKKSELSLEIKPEKKISMGTKDFLILTNDYRPIDANIFMENTGKKSSVFSADFDIENQKILISGKTKAGFEDELLAVYVTDTNGEADYIAIIKTAQDGYFSTEYVPASDSGVYNVSVKSMQEEFNSAVTVRIAEDVKAVLDIVNSKNESDIITAFETYADTLSIDLDLYNSSDKSFIAHELVNCVLNSGDYKSIAKLADDIKVLSLIYAIKDIQEPISVFSNYEGLPLSADDAAYEVWNGLGTDTKNTVLKAVIENKNYIPEVFKKNIYVQSLFAMIAGTNKYIDVKDAIEKYPDLLGIELSAYDAAGMPSSVAKDLCGKVWNQESFKSAFDELVAGVKTGSTVSSGGSSATAGIIPSIQQTPAPMDTPAPEIEFSDIDDASWAEEAVYSLCKKGILDGYDDGTFRPNEKITREEFVTLIVRYLGLKNAFQNSFNDVGESDWFYGYVAAAKESGIVNGISESEFGVGRSITRQDASVMMYNIGAVMGDGDVELGFNDTDKIADYAKEAVTVLFGAGVINGNDDGSFNPTGSLTRAEAAKLIYAYDLSKNEDSGDFANAQDSSLEKELLLRLDIIDEEMPDGGEVVTRSEFAEYIVRFLGLDTIEKVNDDSYKDVSEYTQNSNEIYYLKSVNILGGASDGNFYPDLPITNKEAAVAVARVLGYASVPGNIENHAASLGIIGMNDNEMTYDELVSGLYKALDCECVIVEYGNSQSGYKLLDNYLSEKFGVIKGIGIVKSNSLTTLDGNGTVNRERTVIGSHDLKNNGYYIDDLLGMQAEYYYLSAKWHKNKEGEDLLICAVPSYNNRVTEIYARDIDSFDGKTLKYNVDGKSKSIIIENDIDVIYNSIACPDYELAMLSPQTGRIIYIENGSGVDCVKVETYINEIVTGSTKEYVYFKNSPKLDFNSFGEHELFIYDKEGKPTDEIPVGAVLSMYYSENEEILKAVYSTDVLDQAVINTVGTEYITVDGTDYYVSELYSDWKNVIKDMASTKYKLYFDAYGEVARIEKASGGKTFGYVISAYDDEAGDGKGLKILVENGGIENFLCSPDIKIDGKEESAHTVVEKLSYDGKLGQLITYRTNSEGKISQINTAINRDSYSNSVSDKELDGFKISYSSSSSEYYKTATTVFGVSCPADELTKVFFVASNPLKASDDYYWTGSISSLKNDERSESVIGYTTSSAMGNAEAMVVYGAGASSGIGTETRVAVVVNMEKAVNADGEIRNRITFITSGKLVAYNISPDVDLEEYNVSRGDLLRFAIDRRYEVSEIEMLGDLKDDGTMALKYGESSKYNNTTDSGGAVYRIVSGSVYDYEDGLLCISKGDVNQINLDNPQFEYYRGISNAFICVVDKENREINIGSDMDMIKYVDDSQGYSKVFITTRYGTVVDVVIYK